MDDAMEVQEHDSGFVIDDVHNESLEPRSSHDDDSLADSDSGYWAAAPSTHSVAASIYDYERGKHIVAGIRWPRQKSKY
jgi:hypothetical protein